MNKKIKKLFNNPGVFFRDYFMKKYPVINSEQRFSEHDENAVYLVQQNLYELEKKITVQNFDVDIVYTWVNDKDEEWLNKKKQFSNHDIACSGSADQARFENHNELYYSVLSVKNFLPWVRNIYIVTDNQRPDWLSDDENIFIVDHHDIIDAQYLPTFNSHVIEANLHKIPGLAEKFIYFNDDVIVAKPLEKEHFFRKNGIASIFASKKNLQDMVQRGVTTATLIASENSNKILIENHGIRIDNPLVHTYVPLNKSSFKKCWEDNLPRIQSFLSNKYRSENDLNMATFLVPWSMYIQGESVITSEICYYFNIRSPHANMQYKKLLELKVKKQSPHSICVNDFKSGNQETDYQIHLENFLIKYFS